MSMRVARRRFQGALVILVVFLFSAGQNASAQPLTRIVDVPTGIELALPLDLLGTEKRTKWGTNWRSAGNRLSVDTLNFGSERTLAEVYNTLKGVRGRRLTTNTFEQGHFVLEGTDSDGSFFRVVAIEQGGNVRGLSIVYSNRSSEALAGSIAGSFAPFPDVQTAQRGGAQVAESRPKDVTSGSKQAIPAKAVVSIEPNIGVLDDFTQAFFAPGGKLLATNDRTAIKIWDVATGRPLRTLQYFAYFTAAIFTHDAASIVSAHKDSTLKIWDVATGTNTATFRLGPEDSAWAAALWLAEDGDSLVAAGASGFIAILSLSQGKQLYRFPFDRGNFSGPGIAGRLSKNGARLIAVAGEVVKIWDVATKREILSRNIDQRYTFFEDSILSEDKFIVQSIGTNCAVESLFFLDLANTAATPLSIDAAPVCQRPENRYYYGELNVFWREDRQQLYVSRREIPGIRIWSLQSRRIEPANSWSGADKASLIATDRTFNLAAVLDKNRVRVRHLQTGAMVSELAAHGHSAGNAIASDGGQHIALYKEDTSGTSARNQLVLWPVDSATPSFLRLTGSTDFIIHDLSMSAGIAVGGNERGEVTIFSTKTGAEQRRLTLPGQKGGARLSVSADGKWIFARFWEPSKLPSGKLLSGVLVDARDGAARLRFETDDNDEGQSRVAHTAAFSTDGRLLAMCRFNMEIEIWNMQTLQLVRRISPDKRIQGEQLISLGFSGDGQSLVGGSRDGGLVLWNAATGRLIRVFDRGGTHLAGHVNFSTVAISHNGKLVAGGLAQRATSSGDIGAERGIMIWDATTGQYRFTLRGHEAGIRALTFSPDNRWLVSASYDGTIKYWDPTGGRLAATFASSPEDQWVMITEQGFFAASSEAGDLMSVVRGLELTSTGQLWQSLYNPDLVRQYIAGDRDGEVREAAKLLDLAKVLDSGRVPEVAITQPASGTSAAKDVASVTARLSDKGGGIGRIEWRVNGVTVAVAAKPDGSGPDYTLSQEVALDPGDNSIEVVAYNKSNLLASLAARASISLAAAADRTRPKLHILAVGINAYTDPGWQAPGARDTTQFAPLALAVKDATTFGADMKKAAAALYEDVRVTYALDAEASKDNLEQIIGKLAGEVHPRDTFILFVAAHGAAEKGRFYMIPQDFQSGPGALAQRAIGQEQLQDWLANRIKAKKAVILLDTCESGALVAGAARTRADASASEAAIGRLHEATGRPVLTAAAAGQFAHEGLIARGERHGVFTWALLDALRNGDRNGNDQIELSEIVAHVQRLVPQLAADLGGAGRAAIAAAEPVLGKQTARFGSRGEDFVLARKLQ